MSHEDEKPKDDPIKSRIVREDSSFADAVLEFVGGLEKRIQTMEEAINANDLKALRVAAHQLKGSGPSYGFPVLTQRAMELERAAKAQALEDCRKTLEELKELCRRIGVSTE